ncbi:hypothetical protein WMC59_11160 [Staphylococcus delphini]|uniref:hypothetical protein n=1 Tax=Staphylococcus delphini TaxID=53344 RepID=UPI00374E3F93
MNFKGWEIEINRFDKCNVLVNDCSLVVVGRESQIELYLYYVGNEIKIESIREDNKLFFNLEDKKIILKIPEPSWSFD